MSFSILRPKNRAEWLSHRTGGIGSSEVATILGLNPFETPYQLWRKKKGYDQPTNETFAMRAGHYLEDAVASFWKDATNRQIIKSSVGDWLIINKENPTLRVSPDRTYWLSESRNKFNKGILECKTTQRQISGDCLPKHWFCQLQYQLGVAELEQGSLAWLTAGREFDYRDVAFVPDFYAYIIEEVEKFWTDNIIGNVEPNFSDVSDVLIKYPTHSPDTILEADEKTLKAYEMLKLVKEDISKLDSQKKSYEAEIKTAMQNAERLEYCGELLATWKTSKLTKKFDDKKFLTDNPEICAPYLYESTGARRFNIK